MAETFKNAKAVLGDSATSIYTCPANTTAIIIGAQVANNDNTSTNELKIWWTDSSDTDAITYLGFDIAIPAKSAYEPLNGKLILEAGDALAGSSSTNQALEASISILELS